MPMQRIDTADSQLSFVGAMRQFAKGYPHRAPPVPLFHSELGRFGQVADGQVARDERAVSASAWRALCRDERRFFAMLAGKCERLSDRMVAAQVTNFDSIIAQRRNGFGDDIIFTKPTFTAVAAAWFSSARAAGSQGASSYASIPGGGVLNAASAGAPPLRDPGAGFKKFLVNYGMNHTIGTNVAMLVDILVAAGSINAASAVSQTVNSAALTRYSGSAAAGNMLIYEVTTALGATAQNLTTTYTDQAGNTAHTTAAQTVTASSIAQRLLPAANGVLVPLAAGDTGIRQIETSLFSAANTAGVLAALIYRPLGFLPTIATTTWVERAAPAALGGMVELVRGSDSQLGHISTFVLTSGVAPGVQTVLMQTVAES